MCDLAAARHGVKLTVVLMHGGTWTIDEVADVLEVSRRSAYRYMRMLRQEFALVAEDDDGIKRWRLEDWHE